MCKVSSGVRCTSNRDGGIVLDINQGKVFRLNGVGVFVFERLLCEPNEIIADVCREFGVPDQIVRADIVHFLKSLEHQGLIMASEGQQDGSQTS